MCFVPKQEIRPLTLTDLEAERLAQLPAAQQVEVLSLPEEDYLRWQSNVVWCAVEKRTWYRRALGLLLFWVAGGILAVTAKSHIDPTQPDFPWLIAVALAGISLVVGVLLLRSYANLSIQLRERLSKPTDPPA